MTIDEKVKCRHCGNDIENGDILEYDLNANAAFHSYNIGEGSQFSSDASCFDRIAREKSPACKIENGMYWDGRLTVLPPERYVVNGKGNYQQLPNGHGAKFVFSKDPLGNDECGKYLSSLVVNMFQRWWPVICDLREPSS